MPLLVAAVLFTLITVFTLRGRRRYQRLLEAVEVVVLPDVPASQLGNVRDIRVYLPPGYHSAGNEQYPVLFLNDGQEVEALGLHETLSRLMLTGQIVPIITVAIPTNENRLHEYGTAVALNTLGLGVMAPAYDHFITEELMPLIDQIFRTRPGATILGMSLGGLSAFDIAWRHPERFAAVGVMSGSFWWRAADDESRIDAGERISHSLVRRAESPPLLRLWFQAGTRDEVCDRDGDGIIDAIQDTRELVTELENNGCPVSDLCYVQVDGGRHDYETWSRVLPEFLIWAFSPRSARHKG